MAGISLPIFTGPDQAGDYPLPKMDLAPEAISESARTFSQVLASNPEPDAAGMPVGGDKLPAPSVATNRRQPHKAARSPKPC